MRPSPVLLLVLLAACGGNEPPDPPPPPPPVEGELLIGGGQESGEAGFIELVEGQQVTLVPGSQAGFHIFVNARVPEGAMTSEYITLERTARRKDTGELVSRSSQRVRFLPGPAQGFEDTEKSIPLFLCPTPVGIGIADQTLVLRFGATDDNGHGPVEGQLELIPTCPDNEQRAFCESICNG